MARFFSLCVLLSLMLLWTETLAATSPLLMWSNFYSTNCNKQLSPSTLQTSESVFNNDMLNCITKDPKSSKAILFLQHGMTVDSLRNLISATDGILAKLKSSLLSMNVVAIPAFELDEDPVKSFQIFKDLNVVHLPDDLESAGEMIITTLIQSRATNEDVVLLWTSSNSYERQNNIILKRSKRSDENQKDDKSTDYCIANKCLAMCFTGLQFAYGDSTMADYVHDGSSLEVNCTEKSAIIEQKFKKEETATSLIDKFTLKLEFETVFSPISAMNWWSMKVAEVAFSVGSDAKNIKLSPFSTNSITAPKGWSLTCEQPDLFYSLQSKSDKDQKTVSLQFKGLQVEQFYFKDSATVAFSDPQDCSSWFSAPIILALLIGLFLIIMLGRALSMIASVTTMDRFDDPKGKGISVPQDS